MSLTRLLNPIAGGSQGVPLVKTTTATLTAGDAYAVPFQSSVWDVFDRVRLEIGATQSALIDLAWFDDGWNNLGNTTMEVPLAGPQEIGMPPIAVQPNRTYYVVLLLHSATTTATFAQCGTVKGFRFAPGAFPLPSTLSSPTAITTVPMLEPQPRRTLPLQSQATVATMTVNFLRKNSALDSHMWGMAGGYLYESIDVGATWTRRMAYPAGKTPQDLAFNAAGTIPYLLTFDGTVYEGTGLTSGDTWTDITPAAKSANAMGRPYALTSDGTYLWWGEYSDAPNEISGGPKVHRYDLTGKTWVVSKQFANARHVHAFYAVPGVLMFASLGDVGWGNDVGLWRITPSGIVSGGPDNWTQWTTPVSPRTGFVGVNPIFFSGYAGTNDGLYVAADGATGQHVLYSKTSGSPGSFNLSAQVFAPADSPSGETVRALARDGSTGNLVWFTAETTSPAVYMAAPPFGRSAQIHRFSSAMPFVGRSEIASGVCLCGNSRITLPKFVGQ